MNPDEFYIKFKKIVHTAAEKEIGHKRHNEIPGLSSEVKDLCAQRRSAKIMMLPYLTLPGRACSAFINT